MYEDTDLEWENYDISEEDDYYYNDNVDDEDPNNSVYSKTSFENLYRYCLRPTVLATYSDLLHLFLVCLIFRTVTQILKIPSPFHHLTSAFSGIYVLYSMFGLNSVFTVSLAVAGCGLLKINHLLYNRHRDYTIAFVVLIYLLVAELGLVNHGVWVRIRGPQMVMCMKIISYAFDVESNTKRRFNVYDFFGYTLCPGTLIFGPWVSFADYLGAYENDKWDLRWLQKILLSSVKSLIAFTLSVCLLEWAIPDGSSPFWLMYRDAALFRASHYFVSFVSETSATFAGFPKVEVTRPMSIELPDSLVQVVIYWNMPMHSWLKTYVFKATLRGGTLLAIMSTYLVSALLHGANLKLSAILLSLGVYTYVEYCLRKKLAEIFGSCIGPRPCPRPCSVHKRHSTNNIVVHAVNIVFMLLASFHLAYLGCIVDNTNQLNVRPFQKWEDVSYNSHLMVIGTYCTYVLLALFW